MSTLQVITNLCRQSGLKRIMAIAAVAMLASSSADAAPRLSTAARKPTATIHDRHARYYGTIVPENHFRTTYQWRRGFPGHTYGCSWPVSVTHDAGHFYWPCVRHDLGDRNPRTLYRHNEDLLRHTRDLCLHDSVRARPGCYFAAERRYAAVRSPGKSRY